MNGLTKLKLTSDSSLTSALRVTFACLVGSGLLAGIVPLAHTAETSTLSLTVDKPGHAISPLLYGIFFEDINCSADGGLYAEMVRNRNFEDSDTPDYWQTLGSGTTITVESAEPVSPNNPHSLRVEVKHLDGPRAGVANDGFWGMSVVQAEEYELSLFAKELGAFAGPLWISLESRQGEIYAQNKTTPLTPSWKAYHLSFKPGKTDAQARLVISTKQAGGFALDMVSLFPRKTWKHRGNGMRSDLAEMLAGLKPSFMRFPGGCWVEGETMDLAYRWKQTVGDPSERRTQYNIWQYHATHGLGYHEYLQLCEDLGAEPLFVINCGMSHKQVVPIDKMSEFVQDALDAIEYANGAGSSKWGSLRARNGHPRPYNLKYMEIGNENGGPAYRDRFALFYDAIKAKHPDMHLIANEWGGWPTNRPIELVDEHYYSSPEFFIQNTDKYDSYDRAGRKVYVGEYAVTQGCGQGNLRAAVGEAAFMTGMERNSDVVMMASYAPLFANVNYKKWNPDLIDFDSSRVYGLPSYYVQKMFSENRGEVILPMEVRSPEVLAAPKSGAIGVGTWRTDAEFKELKVTQNGTVLFATDFGDGTNGWRLHGGHWSLEEGALRQTSPAENIRAFAGNRSWSNYTYSLKARKLGGDEGFLIPFLVQNEQAKGWWNIGGWGNTRHAIEMDGVFANSVPGRIDTGRWYDIRIELSDIKIKCFLDDKLVHDIAYPRTKALYAVASRAKNQQGAIIKVVNASPEPQDTRITLNGATLSGAGTAIVLSSDGPEDENSLEQPSKVIPVTKRLNCSGTNFSHNFPGNSVTVLRLPYR